MYESVLYDLRLGSVGVLKQIWPWPGAPTTYQASIGVRVDYMHFSGYSLFPHSEIKVGRLRDGDLTSFFYEHVNEQCSFYDLPNPIQLQPGEKIGLLVMDHSVIGALSLGIETDPQHKSIYVEKPFRREPSGPPAGEPCSLRRLLGGCD